MLKDKIDIKKGMIILILVAIALLSVTVISKYASSPEFHASSIKVLDDKKLIAMGMTTSVSVISTAITALPGDTASPVAEQLSQLTGPLFIIVCAIYLEKFLLTVTGYISFTFLIPIACLLAGIYVVTSKAILKTIAIKITILAISLFMIVPFSVKITQLIDATFQETIDQAYNAVENVEEGESESNEGDSNIFWDIVDTVGSGVSSMVDTAKNAVNVFIDAIAVLIITTCVIPIVVMLLFVWVIKTILGLNMKMPDLTKIILNKEKKIGFKQQE